MRFALCSLDQSWEDKIQNRNKCSLAIERAKDHGADMIAFPEMTLTGFSMNTGLFAEEPEKSESITWFKQQAKKFRIHVVFGLVLKGIRRPQNSLVVINNIGRVIARYSKLHTFSYAGEDRYYEKGEKIVSCKINNERIGLSICYDLRFPELYRILSKTCKAVITIANWPEERVEHWKILLRARAIENQYFMIGVNRIGVDGKGIKYTESSIVVSPRGEILPVDSNDGNINIYPIETKSTDEYRNKFPALKDRRRTFYKQNF